MQGRDVLLTAFMKQQVEGSLRQLRRAETSSDGQGGFDAIGLLLNAVGCPHLTYTRAMLANAEASKAHLKCQMKVYNRYAIYGPEWKLLLRDQDEMDWLSLAIRYGPEEKVNGETEEGHKA